MTIIACAALAATYGAAVARTRDITGHSRTDTGQASRFYPEEVEGGVPGNLPFNNQIRKHTDPLNANGAR